MRKLRRKRLSGIVLTVALIGAAGSGFAQQSAPVTTVPPTEGDFVTHNFKISDGQTLPEVKLHYTTIGTNEKWDARIPPEHWR